MADKQGLGARVDLFAHNSKQAHDMVAAVAAAPLLKQEGEDTTLRASTHELFGPAGQLIPCWGDRLVQLQFQDQDFSWKFLLADVAFPILGVDFLRAHKLFIDPEGHALLDNTGRRLAGQLRRSCPQRRWWSVLYIYSRTNRWWSLLLQPTRWSSQRRSSQHRTSFCQLCPTVACWTNFRRWSALRSGYCRSAMMSSTTSLQAQSRPSSQQHTWLIPRWGRSYRWWWTPRRRTWGRACSSSCLLVGTGSSGGQTP